MTAIKVNKNLEHKKHAMANKMPKSIDSATSKDHNKYPKHGGATKHGSGVSKGLPF